MVSCMQSRLSHAFGVASNDALFIRYKAYSACAEGRKISVTDLGSTNGTYLDEEELPPNRAADLYVGSRIVFGEAPPWSMA